MSATAVATADLVRFDEKPDGGYRVAQIHSALCDDSVAGGVTVVMGAGSVDVHVDGDTIRKTAPVCGAWAADRGMATWLYTPDRGVTRLDAPGAPAVKAPHGVTGEHPREDLRVLCERALESETPMMIIYGWPDATIPRDNDGGYVDTEVGRILEQISTLAGDAAWRSSGNRLVLISMLTSVDERLLRMPGITRVEVGLPKEAERRRAIELLVDSPGHRLALADDLTPARAAQLTGGLTLAALSRARYLSSVENPFSVQTIVALKGRELERTVGDILTVHDASAGSDPTVMVPAQLRTVVAEALLIGLGALRVGVYGPPGVGKTFSATQTASALGVVSVSPREVKSQWVGASERNQRRLQDALRAMAPVMLIIDEAEEALGSRGTSHETESSEVSGALRAMWLEFLGDIGDNSGIHVAVLSNWPNKLDPAIADRLVGVAVLQPSARELAAIVRTQAVKNGWSIDVESVAAAFGQDRRALSARHALKILNRAYTFTLLDGRSLINGADVSKALLDSMIEIEETEELQSLLALLATSFTQHLPWLAARSLGDESALPPDHVAKHVLADGTLDRAAARARIIELQGAIR